MEDTELRIAVVISLRAVYGQQTFKTALRVFPEILSVPTRNRSSEGRTPSILPCVILGQLRQLLNSLANVLRK
jgi:hypothetical protein